MFKVVYKPRLCLLCSHSCVGRYRDNNMSENISICLAKLYYFATVRQALEDKTEHFVKSTFELEKNKPVKDHRVFGLSDQARRLLAELQVLDNQMKVLLKTPLTTQVVMDELLNLRKMEVKYYDYCSQYNEILQSMLSQINAA